MAGTGETSIRSYNYFVDTTIQGGGTYAENAHPFVDQESGVIFTSHSFQFANDSAADVFFRIVDPASGVTDHGRIAGGEVLSQDFRRMKAIWFRGTPGSAFRFWAW